MKKLLCILAVFLPLVCFASESRPTEYHQGDLYFTPRGSSEKSFYGTIVSKTEYTEDQFVWSCTTHVEPVNNEPETHTLNYRYNPKTKKAAVTSDDGAITGIADIIGTLDEMVEVNWKLTYETGVAKILLHGHETFRDGLITITENLFSGTATEDALIGTLEGELHPTEEASFKKNEPI